MAEIAETETVEVEETVEPAADESTDTVEGQVDDSTEETVEDAAEETVEDVAAETVEDAAAETVEDVVEETVEDAADEVVEVPRPTSPYDLPGDWYVIHSYSGYENKVKANLETRIQSMHMEDRIFEVHIPMEDVVEFKGGKKVTVPKKVFPGYILVRMTLDDDSWYAVRNTPGVTGFVAGNAQKPTPLSRREVERFLGVQEEEEKGKPRFKPEWDVGEQVRVVTGPFADFNGVIEELNVDQQKVVVLVNIFGRDTPVELGFEDIQKN
ncbi:MAG TPA: transcription termination/antitermination protein NusG [Acidimicrobiia bacterium]|nr:transcription termination/antitermination protein NusG [Acidimicrobiia bacterium]